MMKKSWLLLMLLALLIVPVVSAENAGDDFVFGDPLPNAPELAARGDYQVGVQALELIDEGRVDILSATSDDPSPLYDRPLMVEVWYPADLADGEIEMTEYNDFLGRADVAEAPNIPFAFAGRAARDATPNTADAPYPLVIVSHGFPGSAYMMTYLNENLASKGYVVVAIAHTDSTFTDTAAFGSTLLNRTLDQWFVLDEMARLSAADDGFLSGLVDADNTAIIGYSMGGYGALNAIGAGYNGLAANFGPGANIDVLVAGNEDYIASQDDRIKAAVLFAPWGGNLGGIGLANASLWDEEALADITVPTLWAVGDEDDVSLFVGVETLFDWSINSERYLLIYENALHNVAPNPPPAEATEFAQFERYSEPAWNERRINNINQHFVTAFLGLHLKGMTEYAAYLNMPVERSNDGSVDEETYWPGFPPRTALGLRFIAAGSE